MSITATAHQASAHIIPPHFHALYIYPKEKKALECAKRMSGENVRQEGQTHGPQFVSFF